MSKTALGQLAQAATADVAAGRMPRGRLFQKSDTELPQALGWRAPLKKETDIEQDRPCPHKPIRDTQGYRPEGPASGLRRRRFDLSAVPGCPRDEHGFSWPKAVHEPDSRSCRRQNQTLNMHTGIMRLLASLPYCIIFTTRFFIAIRSAHRLLTPAVYLLRLAVAK